MMDDWHGPLIGVLSGEGQATLTASLCVDLPGPFTIHLNLQCKVYNRQ